MLCERSFGKGAMTTHLMRCGVDPALSTGSFHLVVEGRYLKAYWLHVAVPARASFQKLDQFLRDIWLECCGHMSAFCIDGISYGYMGDSKFGDRSMSAHLDRVLRPGMKFSYEYDFGSTTELVLKVAGLRPSRGPKGSVQLLARNAQPEVLCARCQVHPAAQACGECGEWFCDPCAAAHPCGTDLCLPVLNSPRTGVCGYGG